ncbi:leucine-rich repeat-containing protein 4C-like [Orussus abietinus]|uniref:leucine-rich repeat-containing protein 4C-like n=1 Tax=Orussus abietinus TaxID=222816 RepID=UPI000626C159|nr:leucine-rich repeat-containing protein 4C-like [Orussus abietinus]
MGRLPILACTIATFGALILGERCADECSCKWKSGKRTVECVDRSLTGIPDWIDAETQVLDISGNNIRILSGHAFVRVHLTNLQRLYLRGCRIDRIDAKALAGLTNLVELDLSNNLLTSVPSKNFVDTPFLRDLILSNNPLERIAMETFVTTPNLVKLDLTNTRLRQIESRGFQGLETLENLKLSGNHLSTLQPGTFEHLNKLTSIELHDNPWICDCHLRELKMWLVKHNLLTLMAPTCHGPDQLVNRLFTDLSIDDFACRPFILSSSRYVEATIGENASISCRVSAVPAAKIKWYWNGRHLTNHSAFSSFQKILIQEEGQFRKQSTLVLTNAQETDSSEFYCVAENRAGSVETNFTLHVSLRTAGMSTLGSGQIAGISAALVVLILFILLIILILFIRLRRMPLKGVKTATPTESVPENAASFEDISNRSQKQRFSSELASFAEPKPPVSLNLTPYVQKPQSLVYSGYDARPRCENDESRMVPCFSSATSYKAVDNPDLIRDTRDTGDEVVSCITEYSGVDLEEVRKVIYPGSEWSDGCTNVTMKETTLTTMVAAPVDQFPPGAKQIRVWQKGVPILPPVSALKRVLGSTRSSPDEGYQEGTGTDV